MYCFTDKFLKKNSHDNLCIVIGINNTTGLSIIRDLGSFGVKIIGLDRNIMACGRASKYCSFFKKYSDEKHLLEILEDTGSKLKTKVPIQVASDELVGLIEKNRSILEKYFLFHWQKNIRLTDIMDKNKMVQFAVDAGLDVPLTFFSIKIPIEEIKNKIKYPSVIKPTFTKDKKLIVINSEEEFKRAVKDPLFTDGFIVQEMICGAETNILVSGNYTNNNGDIIVNSCGKKERQIPRDFGTATTVVSIEDKTLQKLTEKFTRHIQYSGPSDIEFKKSEINGKYMFIEINPRISGINQFYTSTGCHLAYICYLDLKKELNGAESDYGDIKKCVRYISIIFDFITVLRSYNNISLIKWIKDVFKKDSFAVFSMKDLFPFVIDCINKITAVLRKQFIK